MPSAPLTTHSRYISIGPDLLDLLMIVTTTTTLKIYVETIEYLDKHLTNVAININAPNYVKRIGGKWFLEELKKYMLSKFLLPYSEWELNKLTPPFMIYKGALLNP